MSNPNNNTNNNIISDTPAAELNTPATKEAAELNIPSSEVVVVQWSTWEELLLASAVKRHGLKDWEAIAMELQTRQDKSVTPQICQNKFHDLQRRFTTTTGGGGGTVRDDVITDGYDVTVPFLEELRKLRVAELKKEVQRYDLSIQSLQSQVKRLEDEREMSSKANEPENNGVNRSDLEKDNNNDINIIDNKNSDNLNSIKEEAERSENGKNDSGKKLEEEICKEPSGDDENRSVNESNSSGNRTGSGLNPNSDRKPVGADSGHFSSDRKLGDSGELRGGDSGELQGGDTVEDGTTTNTKESSEVQSSASLTTRKRKRRRRGSEGGEIMDGGGDKVEVVNTVEIKRTESLVKSEPLIAFLDVIRSHEHGSVFDHRLDSQKTEEYNNMIRQHVDLQLVHGRLEDGSYSSCPNKFYLDLLLLFNNAIVFFPKSSPEFQAASSLRTLVMEELKKLKNTSERIYESTSMKLQPKFELEASDSLLVKHRSTSAIVVVCRKRSSIAVKPSTSATKTETLADNKPLLHLKLPVKSSSSTPNEDDNSIKFRLKEKPVTGARSVRRGSKSRPNSNPTQSNPSSNQNMSSSSQQSGSAQKGEDMKAVDKKKTELSNAAKKRGAADFLKRIKKTSPAKGSLLEALKGSGDDSKGSKTILPTVQALKVKKKVEEKKVTGPSRWNRNGSGGGRQLKGDDSPSKKNVGRPPKKGKDVPPPKHGRDGESEGSSRRPSKRSRR